jgi:hypothetical protein
MLPAAAAQEETRHSNTGPATLRTLTGSVAILKGKNPSEESDIQFQSLRFANVKSAANINAQEKPMHPNLGTEVPPTTVTDYRGNYNTFTPNCRNFF